MPEESAEYDIWKQDGVERRSKADHVAREEPLQITVDGTPVAVPANTKAHINQTDTRSDGVYYYPLCHG